MQRLDLPYSHAFLDIGGRDTFTKIDDEFCYLLDVDDIFALLLILIGNDLCAAGDLEWLFL